MRVIQYVRWILPKEFTVYSRPFFKEINCDGSFHVQEQYHHDLLTDCCDQNLFFTQESVCFHSMDCFFFPQAYSSKPICSPFKNIFWQNMLLCRQHTFFCKSDIVCFFQLSKIWWQTSVQAWSTLICCHFE